MLFKYFLLISISVCCSYAQTTTVVATPLKDELLRRATIIENRIKLVIKALEAEKKEHLAQVLQEEEKRLETVANNLKAVSPSDVVRLAVFEDQLINIEYRVDTEIMILQRERATQELLLSNARTLREWTAEEIRKLEASTENKEQALQIANELRRDETRLGEIAHNLTLAQEQREIERIEVELRAIEVRLYEALRRLKFIPATTTSQPGTTPTHVTGTEPTPTPTIKLTTKDHTLVPTTLSPAQIRDFLARRATQLENSVVAEIAKLKKENRTAQAVPLQQLEEEVKSVATKLTKITDTDILQIIESELYWLEMRLNIELQALVAQDQRVQKLLAIAAALKQRIVSVEKILAQTPVGIALQAEAKNLDNLSAGLKNAKDDKTVDNFELELALIEKRVNTELNAFGNPTTKKF